MGDVDITRILLIAAVVVYIFVRRFRGQPVAARGLAVLPVVLTVIGYNDLRHAVTGRMTVAEVGALVVCGGISLALGAVRGSTIELSERGGFLWQRYQVATLFVWVGVLVARVLEILIGRSVGAGPVTGTNSLLLMFGLTLAGESAIVALRSSTSGIPFAPRHVRS